MAGEGAAAGDELPGEVAGKARPTAPIARAFGAPAQQQCAAASFVVFCVAQVFLSHCCMYQNVLFVFFSFAGFVV